MNRRMVKYLWIVTLWLAMVLPCLGYPPRVSVDTLFPQVSSKGRGLMANYMKCFDFANALKHHRRLSEPLGWRIAWNRGGSQYTGFLLHRLPSARGDELLLVIALLAGTHDDRAALALKKMLKQDLNWRTRFAIYAALAEMRFYSEYYAGLLLEEVKWRRQTDPARPASSDRDRVMNSFEFCAVLLATIQQPEVRWFQDQLDDQRLVDGAVSEQVGPLLEFRDFALSQRHRDF